MIPIQKSGDFISSIEKIVNGICTQTDKVNIDGDILNIKLCNKSKIKRHEKLTSMICEDLIRSNLKRQELLMELSNPIYDNDMDNVIDDENFVYFEIITVIIQVYINL